MSEELSVSVLQSKYNKAFKKVQEISERIITTTPELGRRKT